VYGRIVNAVERFARALAPESIRRVAVLAPNRFDARGVAAPWLDDGARGPIDRDEAIAIVVARRDADLCGLLNVLTRGELAQLAKAEGVKHAVEARSPELRALLWERGAWLERGGNEALAVLQPRPVVLGGHLVVQAPPRGLFPPSDAWPRPLPPERPADAPHDEPDSLDELLAAADRALGVRLGRRGRDKGAWGVRAATLLGVFERGVGEPDWRGDVELKTVPVAREASGLWRVVEDPAIAMRDVRPGAINAVAKLQRTLWLARADAEDGDATLVSWYLLEWDAVIARLVQRYLHERPKGPAGTDQRGMYLHKRFFAEAGLLATLNGRGSATLAGPA
jgi:hypothetical protein